MATHETQTLLTRSPYAEAVFMDCLRQLLNTAGVDARLSTPDYVLAEHVRLALLAFGATTNMRDGHRHRPFPPGASAQPLQEGARQQVDGEPLLTPEQVRRFYEHMVSRYDNERRQELISQWRMPFVYKSNEISAAKDRGNKDEIDVSALSDQEKAAILHNYDWSDNAADTPMQRAGRKLMLEPMRPNAENIAKAAGQKGGDDVAS